MGNSKKTVHNGGWVEMKKGLERVVLEVDCLWFLCESYEENVLLVLFFEAPLY